MNTAIKRSIGYFLIFISMGLDVAVLGPTLPALAGQTGSSLGAMGIIFFLSAGGVSLGTLLGGWLFDRMPGRLLLVVAQGTIAVLVFLIPHIPWLGLLMALYVVKGIAGGVVHIGTNTLMLWTHGKKAGPFMNALHFFFGLGAFLSPFLLGLLLDAGGEYPAAYHLLAFVDGLVVVYLLVALQAPTSPHKESNAQTAAEGGLYLVPLVLAAMLFLFFYVSAEITFGGWIYTYAVTLELADAAQAAYLTSLFWLAFTLGRLISIPVAIRLSPARVLPVALAGSAAFLGLLIIFPSAPAVLWLAVAGTGFCMAPIWPSGFTLAGQSVTFTARISGFILLGDSIGGMLLPSLTGWLMERMGAPVMTQFVLFSVAATFLAFLGVFLLGKMRKEKTLPV